MSVDALAREARAAFRRIFPEAGAPRIAVAPGRVNLIGEHTDYNDGFVLPMAIDRQTAVAFTPDAAPRMRIHATAFDETVDVALPVSPRAAGPVRWLDYAAGVARIIGTSDGAVPGMNLVVHGDIPIGAGLSSSASLELAVARAVRALQGAGWDPVLNARLSQRAEVEYVGVQCGIMDQFASALAYEGCALLLDCRSLASSPVPIPPAAGVAVLDTGVRRGLAESEYNARRASCEAAVAAIRRVRPEVRALRDVSEALLADWRHTMDDTTYRRAAHVVGEMGRPAAFAAALKEGRLADAGALMNASHASLRDLYEVSCAELDTLAALARAHPGCYGARMTGAGFGGCVVALARAEDAAAVVADVVPAYREATGREGAGFVSPSVAGARLVTG